MRDAAAGCKTVVSVAFFFIVARDEDFPRAKGERSMQIAGGPVCGLLRPLKHGAVSLPWSTPNSRRHCFLVCSLPARLMFCSAIPRMRMRTLSGVIVF